MHCMKVDLNCDLGEGMNNDALLIPLISSANIACGVHAGDASTMKRTIEHCLQNGVAIGAHPSWPDREHFGRREMHLPEAALYDCLCEQLDTLQSLARSMGASLHHVKPHGALYNQSAREPALAATIAKAVKEFDTKLILYGLSNSHSLKEATKLGLRTAHEVFADRTYQDDGSLTPRSQPGALIDDETMAVDQALQMILEQKVTALSGKRIPIRADTICLHGDGVHALAFCKQIVSKLTQHNITIEPA